MTMELYEEILLERVNQDAKHPLPPRYIRHPDSKYEMMHSIRYRLEQVQKDNAKRELDGDESWYGICTEELLEAFAERNIDKMREELIQSIALQVRMVEAIDRDRKTGDKKKGDKKRFL